MTHPISFSLFFNTYGNKRNEAKDTVEANFKNNYMGRETQTSKTLDSQNKLYDS